MIDGGYLDDLCVVPMVHAHGAAWRGVIYTECGLLVILVSRVSQRRMYRTNVSYL